MRAIEALKKERVTEKPVPPPVEVPPAVPTTSKLEPADVSVEALGFQAYERYAPPARRPSEELYKLPADRMADVIQTIVRVEGPVHRDELVRRMADVWGIQRAGRRVQEICHGAIRASVKAGAIVSKGLFLWPKGMGTPPIRHRGADDPRDAELICQEELGQAARLLLKVQYGMAKGDLIVETARAIGFNSTKNRIAAAIDAAIEAEIEQEQILRGKDGFLTAAPTR
jgi:hypothetical protein